MATYKQGSGSHGSGRARSLRCCKGGGALEGSTQILYDLPFILKLKAINIADGAHGLVNHIMVNREARRGRKTLGLVAMYLEVLLVVFP